MINGCLMVRDVYLGNRIFLRDPVFDPNDTLAGFRLLKDHFAREGINLSTQDINPPETSAFVIHNDLFPAVPHHLGRDYVLLLESEAVLPENFKHGQLAKARKVFTWDDRIVDQRRILKIQYSFLLPEPFVLPKASKTHFCAIIAANKKSDHVSELYSLRERLARILPHTGQHSLDLYGPGWHKRAFSPRYDRFRRIPCATWFGYQPPKSWRGVLDNKLATLPQYRFSICYENVVGIPGYITEKIMDCFLAGTVPVYLGAPNITRFVPPECFIDSRDFDSPAELWNHLTAMPEERYEQMRGAISDFMNQDAPRIFGIATFCETLVGAISADLADTTRSHP